MENWESHYFGPREISQPTAIEREEGELYALMRTWHEDPAKKIFVAK